MKQARVYHSMSESMYDFFYFLHEVRGLLREKSDSGLFDKKF